MINISLNKFIEIFFFVNFKAMGLFAESIGGAMDRQKALGEQKVTSLLLKFSIPAIVGMLVNALYNIIDRIFIGHIPGVGNLAITGVGITLPLSTIILAFGMLVGIGTASIISIRLGQGKRQEAENILGNAITLIIILSVAITIIGLLFGRPILGLFGASDKTIGYAQDYMQIIFAGTIFNILSFGLNHSIRADGSPAIAMASMLIGAITNIVLDPVFIFVLGMGVKGGAIATIIAQFCSAVWGLYYFTKGKSSLKIRVKNLKLKLKLVLSIFEIGISPFSMQLAASLVQVISNNALLKYGGDNAVGGMTIINSISTIFLMPIFGLNQGMQPIIGYNYGAKKYDRVKQAVKYPQIAATMLVVAGFLAVEFIPDVLIKFFNSDLSLLEMTENGIRIYLASFPLIGVQIIETNYFQCIGKAKISMFLSLLRQVFLLVPCILILPRFFELNGVWLAGPVSDTLAFIITITIFITQIRKLGKESEI